MKNITLENILSIITFIVAFIGGLEFILIRLNKLLDKKLEPIKDEIKDSSIQSIRNHLTTYLALAEQDLLIGKQRENFYELYDIYTKKYNENSYIHVEYERLHKLDKI